MIINWRPDATRSWRALTLADRLAQSRCSEHVIIIQLDETLAPPTLPDADLQEQD